MARDGMSPEAQTEDMPTQSSASKAHRTLLFKCLCSLLGMAWPHEFQYCYSVRSPYSVFNDIVGPMCVLTRTLCLGVQCLVRCAAILILGGDRWGYPGGTPGGIRRGCPPEASPRGSPRDSPRGSPRDSPRGPPEVAQRFPQRFILRFTQRSPSPQRSPRGLAEVPQRFPQRSPMGFPQESPRDS